MHTFHAFQEFIDTSGPDDQRPSEVHRITLAISRAGQRGITRQELGQRFDLPRRLVDELLAAMVATRQLTATEENGETVYRAAPWTWALVAHSAEEEAKTRN